MKSAIQTNRLSAIEKCCKKVENAIIEYNKKASDPFRVEDVDRRYYSKAITILVKAQIEHKRLLTTLWDNGIFV